MTLFQLFFYLLCIGVGVGVIYLLPFIPEWMKMIISAICFLFTVALVFEFFGVYTGLNLHHHLVGGR